MCWNAKASISSFIVGSIIALYVAYKSYVQKKWSLCLVSLGWLWVISMQLFEYLVWSSRSGGAVSRWSRWAYIFNVTQPIVLFLVLNVLNRRTEIPSRNILITNAVILMYIIYVLYSLVFVIDTGATDLHMMSDKHLIYKWWGKTHPYGGIVYVATLIVLFLFMVRPFVWSVTSISIILVFLLLSMMFYSGYVASMWCFMAVITPLLMYLIPYK